MISFIFLIALKIINSHNNHDSIEGKLLKDVVGYGETPSIFGHKYKYSITDDGLWHLDPCMVIGSNKTGLDGHYKDLLLQSESVSNNSNLSMNPVERGLSTWPNGIIPVDISAHYGLDNALWDKMVQQYKDEVGITIKTRTTESEYIKVLDGNGCWSWVGKSVEQPQELSLGNGCHNLATYVNILYLTIYLYVRNLY